MLVAEAGMTAEPSPREQLLSEIAARIRQAVEEHLPTPTSAVAAAPFAIGVDGSSSMETSTLLQSAEKALKESPRREAIAIGWFYPWMYDQPAEAAKAFG